MHRLQVDEISEAVIGDRCKVPGSSGKQRSLRKQPRMNACSGISRKESSRVNRRRQATIEQSA